MLKIAKEVFGKQVKSKKRKLKVERILRKAKRKERQKLRSNMSTEEQRLITMKIRLINSHIVEHVKGQRSKRISRTIEEIINEGGVNSTRFWDFVSKMKPNNQREQEQIAMENERGELIENAEEIKNLYKNHYLKLLTTKVANTEEERTAEKRIEEITQNREILAKCQYIKRVEQKELEVVRMKLKNKKASVLQGWKYEYLKYGGGEDLINSIVEMMNEIMEVRIIPKEWRDVKIKSIYKKKGKKQQLANQRGLFITSIIAKVLEKIIYNRNIGIIDSNLSPYQSGGRKEHSTIDNLFIFQAAIDYYRYIEQDLYLIVIDAEKCFDKLWLDDCCNELYQKGMNAAELQIIRMMNQNSEVVIETPYGLTRPFHLEAAVKQGRIFGPLFCSVTTDKVNLINGTSYTMIGAEREIENLIFVDDIIGIGSKEKLRSVEKSLQAMEEEKKFTFHNKKSNIMIMKFQKKKAEKVVGKDELNIKVKKGRIEQVKEFKYLGESFNEKGDNKTKIQKRLSKIPYMIQTIKRYGSTEKVGNLSMQVRLKILETVVMPTILYGTGIFTNISKEEYHEIEKLQKKLPVGTFEVEDSTPYWGIIAESGIWPIHQMIHYKKLMAYHWFITSNNSRLAKKVLLNQAKSDLPKCWYTELKSIAKDYDIDIKIDTTSKKIKSQWKKEIKGKIKKKNRRIGKG